MTLSDRLGAPELSNLLSSGAGGTDFRQNPSLPIRFKLGRLPLRSLALFVRLVWSTVTGAFP